MEPGRSSLCSLPVHWGVFTGLDLCLPKANSTPINTVISKNIFINFLIEKHYLFIWLIVISRKQKEERFLKKVPMTFI